VSVWGFVHVVWSDTLDLFGLIWGKLRFFLQFLQLWWPKVKLSGDPQSLSIKAYYMSGSSFSSGHLSFLLLAVVAGGEGMVAAHVSPFSGRPWWQGRKKGRRRVIWLGVERVESMIPLPP
jgi:hypothetical protein